MINRKNAIHAMSRKQLENRAMEIATASMEYNGDHTELVNDLKRSTNADLIRFINEQKG